MTKKPSQKSMSYKAELINSIESNFIFSKKPINRFKFQEIKSDNKNVNKNDQINVLKKRINSLQNCNLKYYEKIIINCC